MDARLKDLLKPEVLNTVNGLELVARIITEGFMSGSNRSQSIGTGQEFSQYKNYQAGDDLRQLDWKMYARSERYYVRQAEIETNITVRFMLDASRSMNYTEAGMSKLQYGKIMIAALGYLARKQSDTFGLYSLNATRLILVPPRFEHQQYLRFLNTLISLQGEGEFYHQHAPQVFDHHSRELIVFVTDLYDSGADLFKFIAQLKTPRNEVVVFHLMGQQELQFDFKGAVTFEDLETGERRKSNSGKERDEYITRMNIWLNECRNRMLEAQVNYYKVNLAEPVEDTLWKFLTVRNRLNR